MAKNVAEQAGYDLSGILMARGVFTIIFGVIALVWPGMTLVTLAIVTAIWLFVSGITGALSSIFMRDNHQYWFLRLILSLIQFGVGAYLVQRPGISIVTFMLAIGLSFVVEGVIELAVSFTDSDMDGGSRMLGVLLGLLTMAGGIMVWRYPDTGSLAFIWVLGLVALVGGTATLWKSIDMRRDLKKDE